ncbi:MAG: N-formylglutamate amidohydrolase [Rhodospirillaceae bacterium]|nr:MAG: N-formylglutamate amidohydrolase [Rhodospirillaceae bacterium]
MTSSHDNFDLINVAGKGGVVLVCEHASNLILDEYKNLGLDDAALQSHIAWDIGAFNVAKTLSKLLDAPLIAPSVSRLIYDCNRPADAKSAIPTKSEVYDIPGNVDLDDGERKDREDKFYKPYRKALVDILDRAKNEGDAPVLITIHSFTPVFEGQKRLLDLGILHNVDTRMADLLLDVLEKDGNLTARRNDPYGPAHGVTYTLSEHAEPRGLLNVMIEIRNDLILDEAAQQNMGKQLATYIKAALNQGGTS